MKKITLIFLFIFLISKFSISQPGFATVQNIDPNTGNEPYRIASGDVDGDNIIDLVMATYDYGGTIDYIKWYKNDGSGGFSETATSVVSSTIRWVDGLTIADIDGQYGDDIIATSVLQGKLVYFPSNGVGGFGAEVPIGDIIAGAGEVVAGDINKDGNMDVALVAYDADKVLWFSGDGTGGFTAETDIASGGSNGPFTIDIEDFDGDTDLDIVVGYYVGGVIEIYYNQYDESGDTAVSWIKDTVTVDSGSSYLLQTIFADVNNDGTMDVAKVDNTTGDVEWFNKVKNGASTLNLLNYNPDLSEKYIARPGAIAVADVDNDAINDVILTDSGTADDAVIWFKGANNANPSTIAASVSVPSDGTKQIFFVAVEDFDYDGLNDIAFTNNQDDRVDWFENTWELLSLEDNKLDTISIYPNPAIDKLYFKGLNTSLNVFIYDVLGKEIISTSINSDRSLDVSNLNSGLYLVKLKDINETYKFIKE